MKLFRMREFLVILFFLIIFNNIKAMNSRPLVIILDGPTCSGKTSLANCFMRMVEEKQAKNWAHINVDDIEDDEEDCDDEPLHSVMIEGIKSLITRNQNVLCDTVINDDESYRLFREKLKDYNVLYVFVHCPLQILLQRLPQRNIHAHNSGDTHDVRHVSDVIHAYGMMYSKTDRDCHLGIFSEQYFQDIVRSVSREYISPQDWGQYARYNIFDTTDKRPFLTLKFEHDLIVHNYPIMQEVHYAGIPSSDPSQVQEIVNKRCVEQIFSKISF